MSDRFNNIYRILSARATWHDYDGGFYHVTICTANRERYFGKIIVGENGNIMELSRIGLYVMEQFYNVQKHYPYAEIPCFIVMPDHIHAIVHLGCRDAIHRVSNWNNDAIQCVSAKTIGVGRDAIYRVSNLNCRDAINCDITINARDAMNRNDTINTRDAMNRVSTRGGATGEANPMLRDNLGTVVRGLKARISKFAHENNIPFAWQSRFYDRIIRNQEELNATAKYIEDNLIEWSDGEDCAQ